MLLFFMTACLIDWIRYELRLQVRVTNFQCLNAIKGVGIEIMDN